MHHLRGQGCPTCGIKNRKGLGGYSLEYFKENPDHQSIPGILYLVTVDDNWGKIGITRNKIKERFAKHSNVIVVCEMHTTLREAFNMEQQILHKFKNDRFRASILREQQFAGWTECFPINMLEEIRTEMKCPI